MKGNPPKSFISLETLGKQMGSLMGMDLKKLVLRVRNLNLSPLEHLGVAERWCPFLPQQQIPGRALRVAIHFVVTKGKRTQLLIQMMSASLPWLCTWWRSDQSWLNERLKEPKRHVQLPGCALVWCHSRGGPRTSSIRWEPVRNDDSQPCSRPTDPYLWGGPRNLFLANPPGILMPTEV